MTRRTTGWKEGVAALGVILSLVFVGYELQQNTKAIQATVRNDLATASREYLLAQATSPELSAAYVLWLSDGETTAAQDRMVMTSTMALVRNLENVFLQVELGTVESDVIGAFGMSAPIFGSEKFRAFWASGARGSVDQGFADAFEEANGLGVD